MCSRAAEIFSTVRIAAVRVAWTDANVGRRFRNCSNSCCDFFQWTDAPLCNRAKVVIPGLLRRLSTMEGKHEKQMVEFQKRESRKRMF
ncbi:hypothetical protein ACET3Z_014852 [Daucus carota]